MSEKRATPPKKQGGNAPRLARRKVTLPGLGVGAPGAKVRPPTKAGSSEDSFDSLDEMARDFAKQPFGEIPDFKLDDDEAKSSFDSLDEMGRDFAKQPFGEIPDFKLSDDAALRPRLATLPPSPELVDRGEEEREAPTAQSRGRRLAVVGGFFVILLGVGAAIAAVVSRSSPDHDAETRHTSSVARSSSDGVPSASFSAAPSPPSTRAEAAASTGSLTLAPASTRTEERVVPAASSAGGPTSASAREQERPPRTSTKSTATRPAATSVPESESCAEERNPLVAASCAPGGESSRWTRGHRRLGS